MEIFKIFSTLKSLNFGLDKGSILRAICDLENKSQTYLISTVNFITDIKIALFHFIFFI